MHVYICSEDQPIDKADGIFAVYFNERTTFRAVRKAAAKYVGELPHGVQLKNTSGGNWPDSRRIYPEIHGESHTRRVGSGVYGNIGQYPIRWTYLLATASLWTQPASGRPPPTQFPKVAPVIFCEYACMGARLIVLFLLQGGSYHC